MKLDPEAIKQLRETRATVLETLGSEPGHFKAQVLADVLAELDPDRDPALAAHRARFRASRPADWKIRAKELGIDRLLFHLAHGWAAEGIGLAVVPVLESRAAEIGEARAAGVQPGHIDATYLPSQLTTDHRVAITYHPSGHLARVALEIDDLHNAELVLDARPGAGHYTIVEERGGSGTMIREDYRDGGVASILNTPWHDGVESTAKKPWTRWVEENLADLARLAASAPGKKCKKRKKRKAR
jgi:hypothetical protein